MSASIRYFEFQMSYTKPVEKTVLVGGCFDVLHYGHMAFLASAATLGNVIVILEPDEKIRINKKRAPIHTALQRAEILSQLRIVDEIFILPYFNDYHDYFSVVQKLQPNYLAVTDHDPQLENKQRQANSIGAELVIVNSTIELLSSSKIILAALEG